MARASAKIRENARQLFLTGAMDSNIEIAKHLKLKPHTVGFWRKQENWDQLKLEIDRRAAEKMVETIATDRVALNVRHYRFWELLLAQVAQGMKKPESLDLKNWERLASILDRAQKGQR
jgi:DNA-binding CsgD family transcriptional regulator